MDSPDIAYEFKGALYLNITNRCSTACVFCIKRKWEMKFDGHDLELKSGEPSAGEVLSAVSEKFASKKYSELVFCGYGEPTMRFDVLKSVCEKIRAGGAANVKPGIRIRVNTNGLGNLVNGRDIVPELEGLVDSLNVSLNSLDPEQWLKLMNPAAPYRTEGFRSALAFAASAGKKVREVVVTAVERDDVDLKKIEEFSLKNGVQFKLRPGL